jgi:hypothetical protein
MPMFDFINLYLICGLFCAGLLHYGITTHQEQTQYDASFREASVTGNSKKMADLMAFHKISQKELDQALEKAQERGYKNLAAELKKNGAKEKASTKKEQPKKNADKKTGSWFSFLRGSTKPNR